MLLLLPSPLHCNYVYRNYIYFFSSVTSLPTITNQDVVVNIPEDVGRNPLSYLAVWSRSSLVSWGHPSLYVTTVNKVSNMQVALSSVTFSENVFPPAPPPITAWYLGSFVQKAHNVQGRVYAVNNSTILLAGFHFDGNAPGNINLGATVWLRCIYNLYCINTATYFRAIIGSSVFSREHAIIPDESGR